ncbi:MAG: glycosyltransferase [Candidatus Taylorbacteria bacterium]|nr:glycosyltransferase [Candidatus Taylorbacteria bacterium]
MDNTTPSKKILVSGYTYVDESTLETFDYYPGVINFLVPKIWPLKGGKYIYRAPKKDNVLTTKAFFTHSNYPIIGGIMKGWMPVFPFVLMKQRPDVVFSASEPNLLTTTYQGIFTKLYGAKHIIFTWENIPYKDKFKGFKGAIQIFIIKLNLLLSDGFVCGSAKAEQMIKSLTNKPTAVMPLSGIDMEFFTRDNSKKSFRDVDYKDSIVFSFAGAIGYRKGVHLIIKAFEELSKTKNNIRLIIAGSGEYDQEVNSMIKQSGLGNLVVRVSWLDREPLKELYNASDIFLYPSIPYAGWEEQFGYSLAEASSMELPVIATESGSISDIVLGGKTGILIKPDDIQALKGAMAKLADDKEERMAMGKAGRHFISENYSQKVVADKYYKFFNLTHNLR